jgi:hypothetical protein
MAPGIYAWPLAYAVAVGSGAFVLRRPAALATLDRNAVSVREAWWGRR